MQNNQSEELKTLLGFYLTQVAQPPVAFTHAPKLIENPSFFTMQSLQTHLCNPLLSPAWLFMKKGNQPISLQDHYRFKQVHGKDLAFLDKKIINQELNNGAALVLEGIDILDPAINHFASQLDEALPCSLTNSVAFFSQSGTEAYEGHIDTDDVLVIQLSGEKKWYIYERQQRRYAGIDRLSREQLGPEKTQLVMRPGDALYLRSGVPHMCHTPGSHSLHLAFDLIDSTPNPKQITENANRIYEYGSAEPYIPAKETMEKYIEILQSPEFAKILQDGTQSVKEYITQLRQTMGRASEVTALSKYFNQ